ncbi:MAG TPA: hypothetical protein VNU93_03820, partial [Verrucomicrobiae bacterium]|nr:hypothetical protein [Verrucomicrobiae bacterium]
MKRGKLRLWSAIAALVLVFSFCLSPLAANAANATNVVVDVVLYTGDTAVNATNFPADLKTALGKLGVDTAGVRVTNPLTTNFNVTDSFAWTAYDHTGNWGESQYPNGDQSPSGSQANKHIIIKNSGKNITFYGYGRPAFKDFMFMPNSIESKKTFTFDLNEAGIKYHSMEGGGFLFNSQISNGTLKGYAIIFDQGGMELFEITG